MYRKKLLKNTTIIKHKRSNYEEMLKLKNLLIFFVNIPRMLLVKRRRYVFLALLTIAIICCFIILQDKVSAAGGRNSNNEEEENAKIIIEYKRLIDDSGLDTSNYNEEFEEYSKIKETYEKSKQGGFKVVHRDARRGETNKEKYLIYEYTKVFGKQKFCHSNKQETLYVNECKYKNCEFTCDAAVAAADVLLFHESDLKHDLENGKIDKSALDEVQRRRSSKQLWLLWNDEANRVPSILNSFKFNWTLSYRLDAEVSDCAYGCKYKRRGEVNETSETEQEDFVGNLRTSFNTRQNASVWFVSNCQSYYRIKFALELSKHFPVSVRGVCEAGIGLMKELPLEPDSFVGKMLYPTYNFLFSGSNTCKRGSLCEINMLTGNKFYLSFESKNCTHYITEKFWSILQVGLIPVVIQPAKQFYEAIAPDTSFIHAQDFDYDPKRLATYLKLVASDFKLYSKYLLWRYDVQIAHSGRHCEARRLCELCTRLNTETSSIYYENIADWFNSDCVLN